MEIDENLILKLEQLSRLQLSPAERSAMQGDLEKILALCEKLKEVDTEGVEPLVYLGAQEQKLRADEIQGMVTRAEALKNSDSATEQFFKVPKVIKKK